MSAANRVYRTREPVPAARVSAGGHPGLVEALDILGVLGFALFFWLLQLLASD
jgi:hypothetical protein